VSNDFILSRGGKTLEFMQRDIDDWTITFVDTGLHSTIADRLRLVEPYLNDEEIFLANYSDGLTDFYLPDLIQKVERHPDTLASFIAVRPTSSSLDTVAARPDGLVQGIRTMREASLWVNGGYFVLRREVFRYIKPGEELVYEPFRRMMGGGMVRCHYYEGFWQCMDTFKDKQTLDELDASGGAPWELWKKAPHSQLVVA